MLVSRVNNRPVYATATGLKITTKGKVQAPSAFVSELSKSERRKLRKALTANGRRDLVLASL